MAPQEKRFEPESREPDPCQALLQKEEDEAPQRKLEEEVNGILKEECRRIYETLNERWKKKSRHSKTVNPAPVLLEYLKSLERRGAKPSKYAGGVELGWKVEVARKMHISPQYVLPLLRKVLRAFAKELRETYKSEEPLSKMVEAALEKALRPKATSETG
ncbi:MAG: hypothetical protein JXP34_12140 [Planctomycetes bacterium]|nr:hypothetical protein [Planctomycetota bacterium]